MSILLDGNILAALVIETHSHHLRVNNWFGTLTEEFATCAIRHGTLLRLHMQLAADTSSNAAWATLGRVRNHPRHVFWDDGFGYEHVSSRPIQGHRQVTDAWLAELARRHGGKIATMDKGLAADQPDVAVLIP